MTPHLARRKLTNRASAKSQHNHNSVPSGSRKSGLIFTEKGARGLRMTAWRPRAVPSSTRGTVLRDAGHGKERGLISGSKRGQPRVQITGQAHRDEAGLRSSQGVNQSDQVRISKVHGQPQAQPQSS